MDIASPDLQPGKWMLWDDLGFHVAQIERVGLRRVTYRICGEARFVDPRTIIFLAPDHAAAEALRKRLVALREQRANVRIAVDRAYDEARASAIRHAVAAMVSAEGAAPPAR